MTEILFMYAIITRKLFEERAAVKNAVKIKKGRNRDLLAINWRTRVTGIYHVWSPKSHTNSFHWR